MSTALSMPSLADTPALPAARIRLSGKQKAAIVVRLLISQGAKLSLSELPEAVQTELIHQMATLRHIDHPTLQSVVEEFATRLEAGGLNFPGALEGALTLLDGTISRDMASRIRKKAGLFRHGDPWARIAGFDIEKLLEVIALESVEVSAVILSKLKVSVAADILGKLPGEQARRIAYAVSLTGDIAPSVVRNIGISIAEQMDAQPERAFDEGPVERVGAILNFSPASTREDVLDGLEQTDTLFAQEVRRAIFTFANIPARVDPKDVPKITRDVAPEILTNALAYATGADEKAVEFILSNMSQRMATQLREDMEALGKIKEKDGEEAMTAVVAAIRELATNAEIVLVAEDD